MAKSSYLYVICVIINLTLLLSLVTSSIQSVSAHQHHHSSENQQCKELNQWNCYSSKNEGYFCNSKDDVTTQTRWYYNKGSCRKFNYKGCNGNRNRFCTKETCVKRCEAILTASFLRNVGLTQTVHIGTGSKHVCGKTDKKGKNVCSSDDESFALRPRPIDPGKVRLGFIPDEWFTFFYSKLGVTGFPSFATGLMTVLFSKEILVCEHEYYNGLSLLIMIVFCARKFGPSAAKYLDSQIEEVENKWKKMHEEEIQHYKNCIDEELKAQWRAEGSLLLMQVKKENIALQLEAAYREALHHVYSDIYRKLEYQVACCNVQKRISQKHMVTWVVDQVSQNLPQTDEFTMKKNKADISAMALRLK